MHRDLLKDPYPAGIKKFSKSRKESIKNKIF